MLSKLSKAVAALAVMIAIGVSTPSTAQTLRLNLEQLEQSSDAVVLGRAVHAESAWTPDRSAILTRVTIQVQDPVTGAPIGEQVLVVPGGQVGDYIHEVSDMPTFRVDEVVAVFLTAHPSGEMIVTGGWQGKLDVVQDPATGEKRVLGASFLLDDEVKGFAGKHEAEASAAAKTAMSVGDFAQRVRKLKRER
ncbi:MAG: hypothetical protein HKN29_15620 [Rhodothermales bacterium]|nr:hypothetical protein [Rhodothermales bacterium]